MMNTNLRKLCMLESVDEVIIRAFESGQAGLLPNKLGCFNMGTPGTMSTVQENDPWSGTLIQPDTGRVFFSFPVDHFKLCQFRLHGLGEVKRTDFNVSRNYG